MKALWRNTKKGYGALSIGLHWLSALTVIILLALGIWMVDLSYYDPWYQDAPLIHQSLGLLLVVVTIIRLCNKMLSQHPEPLTTGLQHYAATFGHQLLYLLLVGLLVSGYVISAADGEDLWVFDWISVPAFVVADSDTVDVAGALHEWGSYCLIGLLVIHIGAALYHHLVTKDKTLIRMVQPIKNKK